MVSVTATTVDCRLACRKPQPQPTVSQVPPTEAVTPDRVSKWTAAFIAVASFVFGIMFMAAMLWIHVKTGKDQESMVGVAKVSSAYCFQIRKGSSICKNNTIDQATDR